MALTRSALIEHVLEIIRDEARQQEPRIEFGTAISDVNIDSIDLVNILFRLEDEYGVNIEMDIQDRQETVGDLIDALIQFIPHDADAA